MSKLAAKKKAMAAKITTSLDDKHSKERGEYHKLAHDMYASSKGMKRGMPASYYK